MLFMLFFQTVFLCLIFSIRLKPSKRGTCPGSCTLKGPIWTIPPFMWEIHRAKGMWTPMTHISLLFHNLSTWKYGISFTNDLISISRAYAADFFPESILWNAHSTTSVCIIRPRGLTKSSLLQRVGQRLDIRFCVFTYVVWGSFWCRIKPGVRIEDVLAKGLVSGSLCAAIFKEGTLSSSSVLIECVLCLVHNF